MDISPTPMPPLLERTAKPCKRSNLYVKPNATNCRVEVTHLTTLISIFSPLLLFFSYLKVELYN